MVRRVIGETAVIARGETNDPRVVHGEGVDKGGEEGGSRMTGGGFVSQIRLGPQMNAEGGFVSQFVH
jgi:hypothetical protein